MDNEGNIYDLQGNFIGTTGGEDGDAPNELILSEIHGGQEKSSAREGEEFAEMEKMLKQGVFPKDLSGTFKKVRQEMGDDFDQMGESPS